MDVVIDYVVFELVDGEVVTRLRVGVFELEFFIYVEFGVVGWCDCGWEYCGVEVIE